EEDLKDQLEDLTKAVQASAKTPDVDPQEIAALEQKAQLLAKEKEDLQNRMNVDNSQINSRRYQQLTLRKKDLEDKIKQFEEQLNQLKEPEARGFISPGQKKQILHQMIQIDKHNGQLRQRIANLRDDVKVLREQV